MKKNNNMSRPLGALTVFLIGLGFSSHALAQEKEDSRPLGCKDQGYAFNLKVLNLVPQTPGDHQSLYFIFNSSTKPVNLYQMRSEDSTRTMYLNHTIRPRQWAALSTGEPKVRYICTMADSKSNYGRIVDCGDTLKVCEYARVKYGMNNRGNYWIVQGNTRNGAVREVTNYGIIPR